MTSTNCYSNYDHWASMYDEEQLKNQGYEIIISQLDKIILKYLPEDANILDLCCGTGQVAKRLFNKGYRVIGIDNSEEMLHCAQKNVPEIEFILNDARYFKLPAKFHAVISTNASLSFVLSLDELKRVFQNVYIALLENGLFMFDLHLGENYELMTLEDNESYISDTNVRVGRWTYDTQSKLGKGEFTRFQKANGMWQRLDWTSLFKAYTAKEIELSLEEIGFTEVSFHYLKHDLGIEEIGVWDGRACVLCRKLINK